MEVGCGSGALTGAYRALYGAYAWPIRPYMELTGRYQGL